MSKRYNAEATTTEYRAPARQASPSSDVLVPFLQSLICGIVVGIVVAALATLRIGALSFAVTFALAWFGLLLDHRRLLWSIERVTDFDIDKNGRVGRPPEPGTIFVNADRSRDSSAQAQAEKKREAILRFVDLVDKRQDIGLPTGQRALRGERLTRHYSVDDEFHSEIGDLLVANGLATRHADGSWALTASVDEVDAALTV